MRKTNALYALVIAGLFALMAGCASTPNIADAKPATIFPKPIEKVQKAAIDALTVTGCDIKKQEPAYVEGYRPHKIGLLVGSGGETIGVWLTALSSTKTEVKVETAKSFAGRVGQKDWDEEIIAEMTKSLGK